MYFVRIPIKYGFKFHQRYPNTPYWQNLGLANKQHLGDDILTPVWTPGYSELIGVGKSTYGTEGGNTYQFFPKGTTLLITVMHLAKISKVGNIGIGDLIFYTGNSGSATNAPHEHVDIWDLKNGPRNPKRPDLFINPATFNWRMHQAMPKSEIFYRVGNTIFGEMAGQLVGLAITEAQFNERWPTAKLVTVTQGFLDETNSGGVFSLPKTFNKAKLLTKANAKKAKSRS